MARASRGGARRAQLHPRKGAVPAARRDELAADKLPAHALAARADPSAVAPRVAARQVVHLVAGPPVITSDVWSRSASSLMNLLNIEIGRFSRVFGFESGAKLFSDSRQDFEIGDYGGDESGWKG